MITSAAKTLLFITVCLLCLSLGWLTNWQPVTQYSGVSQPPLIKSQGGKEKKKEKRSNTLFTRNPWPIIANLFDRQLSNDGISPFATETKQEWVIPIPPSILIQQSPSAWWLPPRLSWQGHARWWWCVCGGGDYHVSFKHTPRPPKGTECFRASVVKHVNLAGGFLGLRQTRLSWCAICRA